MAKFGKLHALLDYHVQEMGPDYHPVKPNPSRARPIDVEGKKTGLNFLGVVALKVSGFEGSRVVGFLYFPRF